MKSYYFLTKLHSTFRPNGMYGHTSVGVTVHPMDTQHIKENFEIRVLRTFTGM
jgi:hypothetical protein